MSGFVSRLFLLLALALPAAAAPLATTPFTDPAGKPVALSTLKGRIVVVNFWATWCGPCREEMPMLNAWQKKNAGRGITVVGIALDEPEGTFAFAKKLGITYPVWTGDENTLALMKTLGNPAGVLPFTLVLDRQGRQTAALTGKLSETALDQAVRRLP